jgi:hypothetical protein
MELEFESLFGYHVDGYLVRLYDSGNQFKHVGWKNSSGYLQTEVFGKAYMVHQIIWILHHGPIPEGLMIDHIDRNPLNNRIENLRLATTSENKINTKVPKNNTTGYKGVLATPSGKYQARLGYKGKKLYLGLFETREEAAECVRLKTLELYGEFAN